MAALKTIRIIGGPTASGKSALAMELAERENGVIINADSMQVYAALPILTAQPSAADRARVPHELYGVLDPNQSASAGKWREVVEPLIADILKRGRTPIVCGGSGLYIKSLIDGFAPIPDIPAAVRARAIALQQELGNPGFHAALKERDPEMAARFHPHHTARLVRAWEVLEATGRSLAEWQREPDIEPPEDWRFDVTLVMPGREVLQERCDRRFLSMMEGGAPEEAKAFEDAVAAGKIRGDTLVHRALGLAPLRAFLKGEIAREEAVKRAQAETRQYAKRQVTWFRHQIAPQKNIANIRVLA